MRAVQIIVRLALALLALGLATWAGLALWYRLPLTGWPKSALLGLLALVTLWALRDMLFRTAWRAPAILFAILAATLTWWASIRPPETANWAPDVARQVTGDIAGNLLTLKNVRNFEWRSNEDVDARWETRTYDLSKLRSLDLFMSYWAGPAMAHLILSFGFEDSRYLAWSIEVKRQVGGEFSPIADLFKSNALVIVAADERDIVRVRTNVRKEDVQLYRLNTPPEAARALLLEYVNDSNALAARPRFYNSIATNCTTVVVRMARAAGDKLPFDWRLLANGYLPEYLYSRGILNRRVPFNELKDRSHVADRAQAADSSPRFSEAIRSDAVTSGRAGP